jgi:predicted ATPase
MLSSLTIRNFKSIVDLTLELGRFNMFIGENGCGKTNILEGLGMAAAAEGRRLGTEDLFMRGLRVARPSLMTSAFADREPSETVELIASYSIAGNTEPYSERYPLEVINGEWTVPRKRMVWSFTEALKQTEALREQVAQQCRTLRSYTIYCADTLALRGLQVQSRQTPLGIYGEGLDVAIAQMPVEIRETLVEQAKLISWLDNIDLDREGARKLEGYKLGRSHSDLYFLDRFMEQNNRLFSAENANEGILHVLFHLVLFLHPGTPRLFAIDNLETSLNPHLLRQLVRTLAGLAAEQDRQALATTHNPAALDGLNLHDDDQRLFVVYRNDDGFTQARRIRLKPDHTQGGVTLKLSELWMRGMLGGIPTHF